MKESGLTFQTVTTYIRHARANGYKIKRRSIKIKGKMVSQYKIVKDK